MKFYSKIDTPIISLILFPFLWILFTSKIALPLIITLIIYVLFFIIAYFSTYYFIHGNKLIIRSMGLKQEIEIERITHFINVKSFWAGPCFSIKRLQLNSAGGMLAQLSPRNQESFIQELVNKNSKIEVLNKA